MRYSASVMLVSVLLTVALSSSRCRDKAAAPDTGVRPDQVVDVFTMHESSSGERLYTLVADTAYVYDHEGYVEVVRPRVRFYDAAGAVHALLVADNGRLQSRTNDLVARGNLAVRTADSTLLLTDSLSWNNDVRLVRTDAPVEIRTPRGVVYGQGLVSDAGLTLIEIQSSITGRADYRFEPDPDSVSRDSTAGALSR